MLVILKHTLIYATLIISFNSIYIINISLLDHTYLFLFIYFIVEVMQEVKLLLNGLRTDIKSAFGTVS